jgi:hypothetical protein
LQEKLEISMKSQILAGKFKNLAFAFFNERSSNARHEDSVDTLSHVFNQGGVSILDCNFKLTIDVFGT